METNLLMHGSETVVLIMSKLARGAIAFLCILGGSALLWYSVSSFIVYNPTPSEKIGYYLVYPVDKVECGDTYIITVPEHYMEITKRLGYKGDGTLLKKVVAVPYDVIKVTKEGILVNNRLLPNSKAQKVVMGVKLEPIGAGFKYQLKYNEFWMMGNPVNSFDSRYFGAIIKSHILKKAVYLF